MRATYNYVHGKVERKIQEIKRSLQKCVGKNHLSVLQWETLGQQISNSINNVPIGVGNKCEMLENLDILTPNRLILGLIYGRCPTAPLLIENDIFAKNLNFLSYSTFFVGHP